MSTKKKPLYLNHPQFEGFEVRQTVGRGKARRCLKSRGKPRKCPKCRADRNDLARAPRGEARPLGLPDASRRPHTVAGPQAEGLANQGNRAFPKILKAVPRRQSEGEADGVMPAGFFSEGPQVTAPGGDECPPSCCRHVRRRGACAAVVCAAFSRRARCRLTDRAKLGTIHGLIDWLQLARRFSHER